MPYGVGATLDLGGSAEVLVLGRHFFSDRGNHGNYPGSFLGNYAVDAGEEVGDRVLVARARIGAGEIVALGDTTMLQTSALFQSTRGFLARMVASPSAFRTDRVFLGVWLICSAILHWVWFRWGVSSSGLLSVGSVGGALLCVLLAVGRDGESPSLVIQDPGTRSRTALFWTGTPADVAPAEPQWKATWSLRSSLLRGGLFPVPTDSFSAGELANAGVAVIALPLEIVPRQDDLERFISDGGHVVFIGGPIHARAIADLMDMMGVRLEPRPLGRFPRKASLRDRLESPAFPSAYPLQIRGDSPVTWEPLACEDGVTVVAGATVGKGSFTVIGDDSLPYGDWLENQQSWNLGNIAFLERLWRRLVPN